jgi:hypothetical protein
LAIKIPKNNFGKIVTTVALFFCAIVLSSCTIGFITLNPIIILAASIIITAEAYKKIPEVKVNNLVWLLALLLAVLLAYPVLMITPLHPASADAATTTALRAIKDKIPFDYGEYGKLNMSYQIGFPLIAKVFSEVLPFVKDYLIIWMLAILAGVLQILFLYLFATELFKSEKAGTIAAALLLASKLVFENMYVGEFAWVLGTAVMLLFFWLYLKKSFLQYIVFPTIFVIHPAVGINCGIMLFAYLLTNRVRKKDIAFAYVSRIIVVPIVLINYTLPTAYNALFNQTVFFRDFQPGVFWSTMPTLPFWIGTGLTIMFCIALGMSLIKKKKIFENKFLWLTLIISTIVFTTTTLLGTFSVTTLIAGRVIEVIELSVLLITALLLSKLEIKYEKLLIGAILIVALFFFFNSSILNHYRSGSKIDKESMEFADKFYEFDKERKNVLFLTQYAGKTAEYSNKVPFDLNNSHTVFSYNFSFYPNEGFNEYQKNSKTWQKIYKQKKVELINEVKTDYIVTNEEYFKDELTKYEFQFPVVLEYKNYAVFKKN